MTMFKAKTDFFVIASEARQSMPSAPSFGLPRFARNSKVGGAIQHISRAFIIILALTLPACPHSCSEPAQNLQFSGQTMGTTYSVVINNSSRLKIDVADLKIPVDKCLEKINDIFSTYRKKSTISRFNHWKSKRPMTVEPDLALVAKRALEIGTHTNSAFNITLDPLINLWGFDRGGRITRKPSARRIREALLLSDQGQIQVDKRSIMKSNPQISINLSGIAKGWAVDEIARLIKSAGLNDFLVEIGGEMVASGRNPRQHNWTIGIEDPRFPGDSKQLVARANISDLALASSGNYLNFFTDSDGTDYHHLIDPRTGYPVKNDILSVSVIAKTCMDADALATSAMILGEEEVRKLAKKFDGASFMFVRLVNDKLSLSFVAGFEKYLSHS
jgi:thiamine biosynthesis lipoprotein